MALMASELVLPAPNISEFECRRGMEEEEVLGWKALVSEAVEVSRRRRVELVYIMIQFALQFKKKEEEKDVWEVESIIDYDTAE